MQRSLVLCYHTVTESWEHPVAVRPDALHAQVSRLLARGYRPSRFRDLTTDTSVPQLAVTFGARRPVRTSQAGRT
jgi:hypothetical protein